MTHVPPLSRREREVMDIVHAHGQVTAKQIRAQMADPPTNAAVRSILRILVERRHLTYTQQGPRYVYSATAPAQAVRRSALKHVLQTFFGGSVEGAMAALLELEESKLTEAERARIKQLIAQAEAEGR